MKTCKVCAHLERTFIDKLLEQGMSPRSMVRRIGGTTRKPLAHHRDRCLTNTKGSSPNA